MTDKLQGFIDGMDHSATVIERDMQRQFGQPYLRCSVCGRNQFGTWGYLRTGWPKCHGYTMTLITGNEPKEPGS